MVVRIKPGLTSGISDPLPSGALLCSAAPSDEARISLASEEDALSSVHLVLCWYSASSSYVVLLMGFLVY